jgi:hypothetical protein
MRKMLVAAATALLALQAGALEMKPHHHGGRPLHRKSADDSFGPYYLGFAGHCNVFELWYDPDTATIYGNEIGCTNGAIGQAVIGTIDTGGTDLYLTVGGLQSATLIDVDLYNSEASWGETAGDDPDLNVTGITLDINPVEPDSGPPILQ